jgi:hypothetical protein
MRVVVMTASQALPPHIYLPSTDRKIGARGKIEVLSYPRFKDLSIASYCLLNKVQCWNLRTSSSS